jgi:hypothetical protein
MLVIRETCGFVISEKLGDISRTTLYLAQEHKPILEYMLFGIGYDLTAQKHRSCSKHTL